MYSILYLVVTVLHIPIALFAYLIAATVYLNVHVGCDN